MNERMRNQPWALLPEVLRDLCGVRVDACNDDIPKSIKAEENVPSFLADAVPYDLPGGVRVIPLSGVMGKRPTIDERYFYDIRDIDSVSANLISAGEDPTVKAVVLSVDSPGGAVVGTPELAALVKGFKKPLATFTDSIMASGAIWVGSQAESVYATPSAIVGSIGVYSAVIDRTEHLGQMGLKVEVFRAGKHKAAGIGGTSLTDEQREHMQARIDAIHAEFRAAVRSRRTQAKDDDMEGQVFSGREAARKGLVTGLALSIEAVAAKLI